MYEVFENDSYIFIVSELLRGIEYFILSGGELLKRLKKNECYSEKFTAKIMIRLLSSLQYLHSRDILHRDIKPENLILRSKENDYDVCLVDFGLADYYDPSANYIFKRCGTPGYVAPELLQDKSYNEKVDLFSAGTIMFLLLSGK